MTVGRWVLACLFVISILGLVASLTQKGWPDRATRQQFQQRILHPEAAAAEASVQPRPPEKEKAGSPGNSLPLPSDGIRLNQIQVKGTHNSYHLACDAALPTGDCRYSHLPLEQQLQQQGVRQLELDLHDLPGKPLQVLHVPVLDERTTCATLDECLEPVARWSQAHPDHLPLFVFLEPKEFPGLSTFARYHELDRQILSAFRRDQLLLPDDVRGHADNLAQAIARDGWPLLDDVRGKVAFVLLETSDHAQRYMAGDVSLSGKVMFVALREAGHPAGVILLLDDPTQQQSQIAQAVRNGYLVRTRADVELRESRTNDRRRQRAAIAAGAHFISTDFPTPSSPGGYHLAFPGDGSVACNPQTASPACQSAALEALPSLLVEAR